MQTQGVLKSSWYSSPQGFIQKIWDIWFDEPVLIFLESKLQNHQQYVATRKTLNQKKVIYGAPQGGIHNGPESLHYLW